MANNTDSNITRKVMRAFIPALEKSRVLSKTVDTQLFQGQFTPASGDYVDIKRPHYYKSKRTATGDISALTANDIISGKATAQVQNYITVDIGWSNKEEALSLDQLEAILRPAAEECVTELETSLYDYMAIRAGLTIGDPDNVVDAWADVASAGSLMTSLGVPAGAWFYVMNPFTVQNLAGVQTGLSADPSRLVQTAWEKAQIPANFGGMRAIASSSMSSLTLGASADRTGALTATPTATYLAHKDTFVQTLAVGGLTVSTSGAIKPGDTIEFTGTGANARSYINRRTRKAIFGADGGPVKWRATVLTGTDTDGSGEGSITVMGPAIKETSTQYDTVSAALTSGDVFNVLGTVNDIVQPNLFYAKPAFSVAFVKLPKLYSTDTIAVTEDGIAIRCSKYSDGDKNTQKIRFDVLPAFACLDPFYAGRGFGL